MMTAAAVVLVLTIALMVLVFIALAASRRSNPGASEQAARAAVALYDLERRMDIALLQHEIRLDGEQMRKDVEDELAKRRGGR